MAHKDISMIKLLEDLTTVKDFNIDDHRRKDHYPRVTEQKSNSQKPKTIKVADVVPWQLNYSTVPKQSFLPMGCGPAPVHPPTYQNYNHQSSSISFKNSSSHNVGNSIDANTQDTAIIPYRIYQNIKYSHPINENSGRNVSKVDVSKVQKLQPPSEPPKLPLLQSQSSPDYRTHKANILKRKQSPNRRSITPPTIMGPRTPPMPPPKTPPFECSSVDILCPGPRTPPPLQDTRVGIQTPPSSIEMRGGPRTPPLLYDQKSRSRTSPIFYDSRSGPRTPPSTNLKPGPRSPQSTNLKSGPRTPPMLDPHSCIRSPPLRGPRTPPSYDHSPREQPLSGVYLGPRTPSPMEDYSSVTDKERQFSDHKNMDFSPLKVAVGPTTPPSPINLQSSVGRRDIKLIRRNTVDSLNLDSESSSDTPDTFYPDYKRKSEDSPERRPFGPVEVENNLSDDSDSTSQSVSNSQKKKENITTSNDVNTFFLKDPFLQKDLGDGIDKESFPKKIRNNSHSDDNSDLECKEIESLNPTKSKEVKHSKDIKRTSDLTHTTNSILTKDVKRTKEIQCTAKLKSVSESEDSETSSDSDSVSSASIDDLEPGEYISDSDVNEVENQSDLDDPFIKYSDYEELLKMDKKRMVEEEMFRNQPICEDAIPLENGSPVLYDMSDTDDNSSSCSSSDSDLSEVEAKPKFPRYFKDKVSFVSETLPPFYEVACDPPSDEKDDHHTLHPQENSLIPRFGDPVPKPALLDTLKETKTPLIKRLGLTSNKVNLEVTNAKENQNSSIVPEASIPNIVSNNRNNVKAEKSLQPEESIKEDIKPQKPIRKLVLEVQGKFTKVKLASPTKGCPKENSKVFAEVIRPKKVKHDFSTPKKKKMKTPVKKTVKESPLRIDLDSRIKIMFGAKKNVSPSKLDIDTPVRYHFRNFPPLRRAPSPFRTKNLYLYWHRETYYYRKHNPKPPEGAVDPFHRRKIGIQIKKLQLNESKLKSEDEDMELPTSLEDDIVSKAISIQSENEESTLRPDTPLSNDIKLDNITVVDVDPNTELELVAPTSDVKNEKNQGNSETVNETDAVDSNKEAHIKRDLKEEQQLVDMVMAKILEELKTSIKRKLTDDIISDNITEKNEIKKMKLDL